MGQGVVVEVLDFGRSEASKPRTLPGMFRDLGSIKIQHHFQGRALGKVPPIGPNTLCLTSATSVPALWLAVLILPPSQLSTFGVISLKNAYS